MDYAWCLDAPLTLSTGHSSAHQRYPFSWAFQIVSSGENASVPSHRSSDPDSWKQHLSIRSHRSLIYEFYATGNDISFFPHTIYKNACSPVTLSASSTIRVSASFSLRTVAAFPGSAYMPFSMVYPGITPVCGIASVFRVLITLTFYPVNSPTPCWSFLCLDRENVSLISLVRFPKIPDPLDSLLNNSATKDSIASISTDAAYTYTLSSDARVAYDTTPTHPLIRSSTSAI